MPFKEIAELNADVTVVFLCDEATASERTLLNRFIRKNIASLDYKVVHLSFDSSDSAARSADRLKNLLDSESSSFLVPLRVTWWVKDADAERRRPKLNDFLVSLYGSKNNLFQKAILKGWVRDTDTRPYEVVVGKGAFVTDLLARFESDADQRGEFPQYVARAALLALERAERVIKGSRYKVPRLVDQEVLERPQLIKTLKKIAQSEKRNLEEVKSDASKCLKEMAATPTPEGLDLVAALGRLMYSRGFDKELDFLDGDLERVREAMEQRPVAFVFTHKSHVDGFLLYALFHEMNLPPVHTFGGINMGFLGLGTMLRNGGAIFIRRTFGEDETYKAVFRNYIDYLASKRFPVNWALEGTRSRTGKLLPPRFGLINYVVGSYLRQQDPELLIIPISIVGITCPLML